MLYHLVRKSRSYVILLEIFLLKFGKFSIFVKLFYKLLKVYKKHLLYYLLYAIIAIAKKHLMLKSFSVPKG